MAVYPLVRAMLLTALVLCVVCKRPTREEENEMYRNDITNQSRQIQEMKRKVDELNESLAHHIQLRGLTQLKKKRRRCDRPSTHKARVECSLEGIKLATKYLDEFRKLSESINSNDSVEIFNDLLQFNKTFYRRDESDNHQLATCTEPNNDKGFHIRCSKKESSSECTAEIRLWHGLWRWSKDVKFFYNIIQKYPTQVTKVCRQTKRRNRTKSPAREIESTTAEDETPSTCK